MNFPKPLEELLFGLRNDDVIGRMEAASELVRFGKERGPQDALKAATGDPFWAVRESAVLALGRVGDPALVPFLKPKCADAHPRVRTAALFALGESRQPGLAAFFKKHFRQERSVVAQAEALKSLGKTGDPSATAFLEKAEKIPSFRNIIRDTAREVLKLSSSRR